MRTLAALMLLPLAAAAADDAVSRYKAFSARFSQGHSNVTVVMDRDGAPQVWSTVVLKNDESAVTVWSKDWSKRIALPHDAFPIVAPMDMAGAVQRGTRALCDPGAGKIGFEKAVVQAVYGNPARVVYDATPEGGTRRFYASCVCDARFQACPVAF